MCAHPEESGTELSDIDVNNGVIFRRPTTLNPEV